MRIQELNERAPQAVRQMTDQERHGWITFLIQWLSGSFMHKATGTELQRWTEFSKVFPHGVTKPMRLYRLMTIPRKYVKLDEFSLQQPAPGPVGSWTSTKVGIDCVAGVARDFAEGTELEATTARIAIAATIEPNYLLATIKSIRMAFLALTHDWETAGPDGGSLEYTDVRKEKINGKMSNVHYTKYHPYLGDTSDELHQDLGYYIGMMQEFTGGPYRQYEHIVITHPVQARKAVVYRDGENHLRYGNDDPHNY